MRSRDWHVPTIADSPLPDRWGPVDRIIAGAGVLALLTLIVGSIASLV